MSEKKTLAFKCDKCGHQFKADEYRRIDKPERDFHPYDYVTHCTSCDNKQVSLEKWQVNLLKAWTNASGPKNTDLSRFNAITHGLTAKVAQYHPARPGSYGVCENCEWLNNGCGENNNRHCLKRTEIYMRHRLANHEGDITALKDIFADTQAGAQIILENMMLAIMQDGVRLEAPQTFTDKVSGKVKPVDYIDSKGQLKTIVELKAHPLLKPFIEMLSKNNLSLADMMLTQKQQGEDATLKGFLEDESENREEARKRQELFERRQSKLLELVKDEDPFENIKHLGGGK